MLSTTFAGFSRKLAGSTAYDGLPIMIGEIYGRAREPERTAGPARYARPDLRAHGPSFQPWWLSMKVLVTGAGGFLGQHTVQRLIDRGHDVRAVIRPASKVPSWSKPVDIFRADLRNHDNLVAAFDQIDAVLHLAAATSWRRRRPVYDVGCRDGAISGCDGQVGMQAARPCEQPRRLRLAPHQFGDDRNISRDRGSSVRHGRLPGCQGVQERLVTRCAPKHGWDVTILRPGFVWGVDHAEIGGMGRHVGKAHIMFGPLTRLPLTHVVNCADATCEAIENPPRWGRFSISSTATMCACGDT